MLVYIPQGISGNVDPKNEEELQEEIKRIFNSLCTRLNVDVETFLEVIESLSEQSKQMSSESRNIHAALSVDTLKKYRKNSFPKKYIFKDYRTFVRTIKKAVAIYIGVDIEDYTEGINGTIIPDNERNESCCRLPKEHTKEVEYNWRANKGYFEQRLFECHESARMLYFPEHELKRIEEDLNAASFTLDYFNRLKNGQVSDQEVMTVREFQRIVCTIQQIPDVIEKIKTLVDDLKDKHMTYVIADSY